MNIFDQLILIANAEIPTLREKKRTLCGYTLKCILFNLHILQWSSGRHVTNRALASRVGCSLNTINMGLGLLIRYGVLISRESERPPCRLYEFSFKRLAELACMDPLKNMLGPAKTRIVHDVDGPRRVPNEVVPRGTST